jgi:hypothetical protein
LAAAHDEIGVVAGHFGLWMRERDEVLWLLSSVCRRRVSDVAAMF